MVAGWVSATLKGCMTGVIVVDKAEGWTSHDVVAKMRRLANTKKRTATAATAARMTISIRTSPSLNRTF